MTVLSGIQKIAALNKFALLYKLASLFSFAGRVEVGEALKNLVGIISPEQLESIYDLYTTVADPGVPSEERQQALESLDTLSDSILQNFSEDDRVQSIYNSLDIINENAEEEFDGSASEMFDDSVEQARNSVDYQEGEEIAQTGQGSVTEDINKKRERDREYQAERRRNPIYRQRHLEIQKEYNQRRDPEKAKTNVYRSRAIKALMNSGLSKPEAEKKFNEDIEKAISARVSSENMTKEEAAEALSQIKSEEIRKYLANIPRKQALTPAERKKKSRMAKAYAEKILANNPDTDIDQLKSQVKRMSIEELQQALENLAA